MKEDTRKLIANLYQIQSMDETKHMNEDVRLELLEKISHKGTDIMSFKFSIKGEQKHLSYEPGQFIVMDLGTKEDPEGPSRCFTIASSPTEKDVLLISTRIRETPFKRKLASLNVGAKISSTIPQGKFVLDKDTSKTAVMLSGGIGVTPFRSMIKYATDQKLPIKIIMFDSNRNEENILYKKDFDECLIANKNLKIIYTLTEKSNSSSNLKVEQGRIDKEKITKYLGESEFKQAIFYLCGPPGLLNTIQKLLKEEMAIPENNMRIEEFTGY